MDYALQVHGAKYVFPIPDGLKELSSDIIREVLRHQPEHINGFIADYLETMLSVRENARESAIVICDIFQQGSFFDDLYKSRGINRDQANVFATIIQSCWRGYNVRRKVRDWIRKKQKFLEERERRKNVKIDEFLAELGITYAEATRAAEIIQDAYKESKRGKWISNEYGEFWVGETIPFGQRIQEGDRALGRFDKWDKTDFGDFFEMDDVGNIKYNWPRVGQLRKLPRDEIPDDAQIVEFFAMRDLQGKEQYSYLIKQKVDSEIRGIPIGFLIPVPKALLLENTINVEYTDPKNVAKMGPYSYIFRDDITREELQKFDELLKAEAKTNYEAEIPGEFDYNPHWVLPRALIRIKQNLLLPTDDEVKFTTLPAGVVCESDKYTFRAETLELTSKIIRYILRDECLTPEDGIIESANLTPYKIIEMGRIFPVEMFNQPDYVQKIEIVPESDTGDYETKDVFFFDFVFYPLHAMPKVTEKDTLLKISVMRFQGHRNTFRGSAALENKVFILGPRLMNPNGKAFTYESLFWEEFGEEAWYKLLYDSAGVEERIDEETERILEEEEEEEEEEKELMSEDNYYEQMMPQCYDEKMPEETLGREVQKEYPEPPEIPRKEFVQPVEIPSVPLEETKKESSEKEEYEKEEHEKEAEEEEEEFRGEDDAVSTPRTSLKDRPESEKSKTSEPRSLKSLTKSQKRSQKSSTQLKKPSKSTTDIKGFEKSASSSLKKPSKSSSVLNKLSESSSVEKKPSKSISDMKREKSKALSEKSDKSKETVKQITKSTEFEKNEEKNDSNL